MPKEMTRVHSLRWETKPKLCFSPSRGVVNSDSPPKGSRLFHAPKEVSPTGLALRHSRWLLFCPSNRYPSTFLRSLRSRPVTTLLGYYGRSDSCPPGSSALPCMNSVSLRGQVSLIHMSGLPIPPSPTTHQSSDAAFARYPSARRISPSLAGSRLHQSLAGSPILAGRIEFVVYGCIVHPLLLSTPPHGDAVAVGLQAGERMPEEDFHLSGQTALRRTRGRIYASPIGTICDIRVIRYEKELL